MKTLLCALFCLSLCSCGYVALDPMHARPSADYWASGSPRIQAFVYGKRTVLTVENEGFFSARPAVFDENNKRVRMERIGRYYRLERKLDRFTVRTKGWHTSFAAGKSFAALDKSGGKSE